MLFDSHCHLNDEKFDGDRDEVIKNIKESGVEKLVVAGWNVESSKKAIELSQKYDFIYATCGISPNDVEDCNRVNEIEELICNYSIKNNRPDSKAVVVGEIGLDYYWNKENKDVQKELFIKQIEIANRHNMSIQIHTRDAWVDTIEILKAYPVNNKGIFHCCPLNQELIKAALELGFYISFSGNVTFKNAKSADDCIKLVPLEKLLIETDSPYMTPEPNRGKRNDSKNVAYVAAKIAEIKGLAIIDISKVTYINACNVFDIKT